MEAHRSDAEREEALEALLAELLAHREAAGRVEGEGLTDVLPGLVERLQEVGDPAEWTTLDASSEVVQELMQHLAVVEMVQQLGQETDRGVSKGVEVRLDRGRLVGPYRILDRIGSGGMGTAYRATVEHASGDLPLGGLAAVKVIHPHLIERPGMSDRFLREAEAGRRVRHESVVRTLGAGSVAVEGLDLHYIATEYVEGETLHGVLRERGPLPEPEVREVGRQVADALRAIHEAGLVHRDLKPANVVMTASGRVRVMDLGMARLVDTAITMTRDGQFLGSLLYAAPEQIRGRDVGPPADQYALGILLYELLTGSPPYSIREIAAAFHDEAAVGPPPAMPVGIHATAFFRGFLRTLMNPDPNGRFESASALAEVLESAEASPWWFAHRTEFERSAQRAAVRVDRRTPFVGRRRELSTLMGAWRRAREGEGSVVLLSAEPGLGRTRLLDEFLAGAASDHGLYASFRNAPTAEPLARALADQLGLKPLEEKLGVLLEDAPVARDTLIRFIGTPSAQTDPESAESDVLATAVGRLMVELARDRPLLWILDDIGEASGSMHAVVQTLARSVADRRALLVLAAGSAEVDRNLLFRLPRFDHVELPLLTEEEMTRLLESVLTAGVARSPLLRAIRTRAEGSPARAVAWLDALAELGVLRVESGGRYRPRALCLDLPLPEPLEREARERLDGVSGRTRSSEPIDRRELLRLAAVCGPRFDAYLLAAVLERAPIEVLRILAEIERQSGIVSARKRMHVFTTGVARAVLLGEVEPDARRAMHAALAAARLQRDALDPSAPQDAYPAATAFLARHLLRGDDPATAGPWLLPALRHLDAEGRNDEAVFLALEALARGAALDEDLRAQVLRQAARSLQAGGWTEGEEAATRPVRRLVELAGGPDGDALAEAGAVARELLRPPRPR